MDRAKQLARSIPLARYALAGLAILFIYASLRPFSGWRDPGRSPFAFLFQAASIYVLPWDIFVNIAGYVPIGFCAVLAVYPRVRGAAALAIGILAPTLFSLVVEALQTYIPSRTPSQVDVFTNFIGALLGASLAALLKRWLIDREARGNGLRARWIVPGPVGDIGLVLLGVWLVTMTAPRTVLYGTGDMRRMFEFQTILPATASTESFGQMLVSAIGVLVSTLTVRSIARDSAPILRLALGLVVVSLTTRSAAFAMFWAGAALDWATPPALIGIAIGGLATIGLVRLPREQAAGVAAVLLAAAVIIVNLLPLDVSLTTVVRPPRQGAPFGAATVARNLALLWPVLAAPLLIWCLCVPARDPQRSTG
jgi:VanZ family protein